MAAVGAGVGIIIHTVLVVGFLVVCHALTLPNEEALLHKIEDALTRIDCIEEELHRYKIDETYCGKVNRRTRIVGGETTEVNEYPWQVAVVKRDKSQVLCGGSLINDRWIITSAHCQLNIRDYQVILGNHYQDSSDPNEARKDLKSVVQHPNYTSTNWDNDFAMLELLVPLNLNTLMPAISPVCLPRTGAPSQYDDVDSIITGWGRTSSGGSQSNSLQEAIVKTMDNTRCNKLYRKSILPSMICAAYPDRDTCQGDSGGPLITEVCGYHYLIGITSWGKGCAEEGYPGVYARVTDALDWITQITSSYSINNDLINACVDISPNCAENEFQCDTSTFVQEMCRKTCNICLDSTWSKTSSACLRGHNDKSIKTPNFEACKKKCLKETVFVCESVDYFPPDQNCQLSKTRSTSNAYEEPCYSPYVGNLFAERIHASFPSNSKCKFPFKFKGETYHQCTTREHCGVFWCSTQTDENDNHKAGKWTECNPIVSNSNLKWHCVGPTDRFVRFDRQMSWTDARALCKRYSLDLFIPADSLAVSKYLKEKFDNTEYWIGGRGNGKHLVWITGSVVPIDGPWYSKLGTGNVGTNRCLFIRTSGNHPQEGKVLSSGDCVWTGPSVLCG